MTMRHALPFLLFVALPTWSNSLGDTLTPDALLQSAAKMDGKTVTVRGEVTDFKQKTSRKGNHYFTFRLATKDKDQPINVYGRGILEPAPKPKAKVEVLGKFAVEKKMPTFTVKNEIDVSGKTDDDKPGVKLLGNGK